MQDKITSFLWFDKDLKKVIRYYKKIFNVDGKENFKELAFNVMVGTPSGKVELATVKIFGNTHYFMAAGPYAKFSDAISLMIITKTQAETDYYWNALTEEGEERQCGWCRDKYGLSWQITPKRLLELNTHKDKKIAKYATQQMLKMKKIIIKDLEK